MWLFEDKQWLSRSMYFVLSLVLPSSSNGKLIIFIFWSSRPLFLLDLGWYFFRPLLIYDYVYVTCNTLTMWCYYYWPQWEWGRVPFIWLITQPGCLPRTRPQCPSPVSDLNKRYAEFGLVRVVLSGSASQGSAVVVRLTAIITVLVLSCPGLSTITTIVLHCIAVPSVLTNKDILYRQRPLTTTLTAAL